MTINYIQNEKQNRGDSLWYGGRVAEVEHKGYTFILGAFGDVRATLLDSSGCEIAEVRDKNNDGLFYDEMRSYICDDKELYALDKEGRLVFENNNWWEVLIDAPDGEQYDLGWVCNESSYRGALEEILSEADKVIEEIEKTR